MLHYKKLKCKSQCTLKEKHGHAGKGDQLLGRTQSHGALTVARKTWSGSGEVPHLTASHFPAHADVHRQGGGHGKGMNSLFLQPNTAEIMAILTQIWPSTFRYQIVLVEWLLSEDKKRTEKKCYLELERSVLVSINPLSDPTVVIRQSLQKIIVNIKSYPQTEQGDVVLYVLLHIFLNFWQL